MLEPAQAVKDPFFPPPFLYLSSSSCVRFGSLLLFPLLSPWTPSIPLSALTADLFLVTLISSH